MPLRGLDYDAYEIGKDANNSSGDEYEDQNPCNAFFKIGVLAKEMACIKEEPDKEDDPKNNRENSSNGIGNIVYRIFDTSYLCKNWWCGG